MSVHIQVLLADLCSSCVCLDRRLLLLANCRHDTDSHLVYELTRPRRLARGVIGSALGSVVQHGRLRLRAACRRADRHRDGEDAPPLSGPRPGMHGPRPQSVLYVLRSPARTPCPTRTSSPTSPPSSGSMKSPPSVPS